jgi:hypothetical protein
MTSTQGVAHSSRRARPSVLDSSPGSVGPPCRGVTNFMMMIARVPSATSPVHDTHAGESVKRK